MNPHYKDPVIVFGVAVPVLLIALTFGLGMHFRGKLEGTYKTRKAQYADYKTIEGQRESLEKKIHAQEPHMNRWRTLFETPAATAVNGFFREFQKGYEPQEFQQIAFRPSPSSGGIGGASSQPSMQLHFTFKGTYRALQTAFLELETRMPHLQLDSIKLKTETNQNVLNATVVYTAWQKK